MQKLLSSLLIGNLIPRGPASSPWGWGVWGEGDAFWVPRTSHKCAVAWSMVLLALGSPINWALRGFWAAGNTPALKLLAHYSRSRPRQVPSSPKTKGPRWRDVLGFPGQLRLAELLAAGVFEELGIRLAGDAGIRIGHLPNWLGWAGSIGRGAGGRVLPEPAVFEDLADDVALVGLDEGDDLHGAAAARAAQRVGLVDALDEHGPAPAIKAGRRRDGRLYLLGCGVPDLVWAGSGVFGSHAARLVGVVAVVADQVLALVGDVLDQFSEEVQGPEDLEVAGHATKEVRAGRLGEVQRALLLGAVDDLDLWADEDHSGEAEC